MSFAETELPPLLVRKRRLKKLLDVGDTTIWQMTKRGILRVVHIPGVSCPFYDYAAVVELIATAKPASPPLTTTAPTRRGPGRPRKIAEATK